MRMSIDKPRQNQPPPRSDRLRPLETPLDLNPRPNTNNRISPYRHAPILINRPRPIHRHHDPTADDEIHVLRSLRKQCPTQEEEEEEKVVEVQEENRTRQTA